MGQACCNIRQVEKKTIDVPQADNPQIIEEPVNNSSKNNFVESNAIMICSNKSFNEINYNICFLNC